MKSNVIADAIFKWYHQKAQRTDLVLDNPKASLSVTANEDKDSCDIPNPCKFSKHNTYVRHVFVCYLEDISIPHHIMGLESNPLILPRCIFTIDFRWYHTAAYGSRLFCSGAFIIFPVIALDLQNDSLIGQFCMPLNLIDTDRYTERVM